MMSIWLTLTSIKKSSVGIWYAIREISGMNLKVSIFTKITLIPVFSLYSTIKPDKSELILTKPTD